MSGRADEASDQYRRHSEHDFYWHPDVVKGVASSLQKVHDIYGLGIILGEVSYWQRTDEIPKVPKGEPEAAMNVVSNARCSLPDVDHLSDINIFAREEYADLVRRCLGRG